MGTNRASRRGTAAGALEGLTAHTIGSHLGADTCLRPLRSLGAASREGSVFGAIPTDPEASPTGSAALELTSDGAPIFGEPPLPFELGVRCALPWTPPSNGSG